jgi:hypothetical protein
MDGEPPSEEDTEAYLGLLDQVKSDLQGVHLYGYARPSYQVEAPRISRLPHEKLEAMAERIRALGLIVHVSD